MNIVLNYIFPKLKGLDTSVPIIMDDTYREDEYNFAVETAELLGKTWTEYKGWQKNFIVIS